MKKILFLLLVFSSGTLLFTESCKKTSTYYDAVVIDDGDEAIDAGCGWLLSIDGKMFYADGLKDDFKVDGKKITIQYQVSAIPHTCPNGSVLSVATITRFL